MDGSPPRAVTLVHTSDVHIGCDVRPKFDGPWPERGIACLAGVVDLVGAERADALLISGDLFDHNRVGEALLRMTAELLERAAVPVAILPGNHDPYTPDSAYRRGSFPANVSIIRSAAGELVELREAGIQVWGQAHVDYYDFAPLGRPPQWASGEHGSLWRVVLAHGLYVRSSYESRFSYRIHDRELEALQAHYVGLGHLEGHESVGPGHAPAHYAGAPERTRAATLIRLSPQGLHVGQAPLSAALS